MTVANLDWAQASSDWAKALTVIGPSVCTAIVALLVARWARSHDVQKDRRRRHQDNLEKISESFQAAHATTNLALNAYVHYCELAIVSPPEFPSQALDADLIKRLEAFVKAKEKLSKLIGLLKLMRLRHAVSAVEQYYEVIREVTQNLNFHDLSPRRRESAMNLFAKLKSEQEHVEVSLSTEYDKI